MPASHTDWTVEQVHDLPDDGNRHEVIDGELLMSPVNSYLHQEAVMQLYKILFPYVEEIGQHLIVAPAAVTFSRRREVQPDLFVLPKRSGRRPTRFEDVGTLTLAVEVLSLHSTRTDRTKKRDLYEDESVPEYWIVDQQSRSVARWHLGSERPDDFAVTLTWQPEPARGALTIDLVQYFRAVHDEA